MNTLINETLEQISQSLPAEKMRLITEVDHYWVERGRAGLRTPVQAGLAGWTYGRPVAADGAARLQGKVKMRITAFPSNDHKKSIGYVAAYG